MVNNLSNIVFALEKLVWGVPLIVFLISIHIYLTFKLKFPQRNTFKGLKYIISESDKSNSKEGISSFKSLMSVLAGTLGTGNIIGVASAIIIGGVGSIFWMFISGVFAIATKYAETFLVLKYRKRKNEKYIGGAMYVLKERIGNKFLAIMFAVFVLITTLGMGALIQSNAITSTITENYSVDIVFLSIIIVLICGYILFGDERRISNISSVMIPIAVFLYIISCIYLLVLFKNNILNSIFLIIKEAFNFKAVGGGILGSSAIYAMSAGMSKGLFTNEAGMGTSPLFDVSVKQKDIKKQSMISSTTVFIDTVFLCTITGIIFVASNAYLYTQNPVSLAQMVFLNLPFGNYIFVFMIVIFAIATIPCSGYYGSVSIDFLFNNKKIYVFLYKIIYLIFIYIGCNMEVKLVWAISSIANAFMIFPNIYMVMYLKDELE